MKRIILAAVAWAALSSAVAVAQQHITDVHGEKHYKGYLGHRSGLTAEQEPTWSASKAQIAALPDNYDSRALGFVAPIRNQGSCGSCWAHSVLKTFESSRLSHGLSYLDLSEQDEMMNGDGNNCSGGYMSGDHLVKHGSTNEASCPYVAAARACSAAPADHGASWAFIGAGGVPTVDDLRAAIVAHAVISVTVAAGGVDWQGGNSGHMNDCSNTGIDHMVNLVGYAKQADGSFQFIGANSWGTGWGDKGFFYARQGCDQLASGGYSALYIDASGTPGPTPPGPTPPGPTPPPPSNCTKAAPTITLAPARAVIWRGQGSAAFTATIKDNNSAACGSSVIKLAANSTAGISLNVPASITLAPGASGTATVTATIGPQITRGAYALVFAGTDSVSGQTVTAGAQLVVFRWQGQ